MKQKTGYYKGIRKWLTGLLLMVLICCPADLVKADTFRARGIDVSRWQGKIDWAQVKADGIEFVMVGAGRYQSNYVDPQLRNNLKGAAEQGIHAGVYLYSEAVTVKEAREEANFVLDLIDGYTISYPVAFDMEDNVHRKLTTKQRTDITIAFLEVIREAGYYPMIYASENWFQENMDLTRLTQYDKWVARWADKVNFQPLSMWQYSATGRVKGIAGDVDLDYSFVDYSKIITPRTTALKRSEPTDDEIIDSSDTETENGGSDNNTQTGNGNDGSGNNTQTGAGSTGDGNNTQTGNGNDGSGNNTQTGAGSTGDGNNTQTGTGSTGDGNNTQSGTGNNGSGNNTQPEDTVQKSGWQTDGAHIWYIRADGTQPKSCLEEIDGKTYYFSKKGYRLNGWRKINGNYLYFRKNGSLKKSGWLKIKTKKYYISPENSERLTGWQVIDGQTYYLSKKGVVQTGWKRLKGKYYYFDAEGVMQKGLITADGKEYYLSKKSGRRLTGWRKLSGQWYYFGPKTGAMQKGCYVGRYKLEANGVCLKRF